MEFAESTSRIIFILGTSIVIWVGIVLLSRGFVTSVAVGSPTGKRLKTLTGLVNTAVSVVIFAVAAVMILQEVGFNIAPLLASAGVVGLAIGFGAQTLVKDVISGVFLLMENQFTEGEEVEISGKKGEVKKVTLRTVWLEEKSGTLHIIPNGSIPFVTNFSRNKK